MGRALTVVVPTYNEYGNVTELLERITASLKGVDFDVVFVDDGSPDGTAGLLERLGKNHGNVTVHRRPRKIGLASAVLEGIILAKADAIAVIDADLQHPPELLPQMYQKLKEGYDIVIASRYHRRGGIEDWSLWRKMVSKGANILAHIVLPRTRKIRDPMSGYFLFKMEVLNGIRLNPTGFKILLEVLSEGEYNAAIEVPYIFKPRQKGGSKLGFREIAFYVLLLFKLKVRL